MFHANFLSERGKQFNFEGHHWKEQTFLHKIRPIARQVITGILECNPQENEIFGTSTSAFEIKNIKPVVSPELIVSYVLRLVHYFCMQSNA